MGQPLNILIVEDEPLIAMMLEDFLSGLGHGIAGTCETIADAIAAVEKGGFDLAILDVNVDGERVWPVAQALRAAGKPFLLATGGHLDDPPPDFAAVPTLAKPYTQGAIQPVIDAALAE